MAGPDLVQSILARATSRTLPDGSQQQVLSLDAVRDLAEQSPNADKLDVERSALEHGVLPERYLRNLHDISLQDQLSLLKSRVLLIGLGGLGGHVLDILARAGVGEILAMDGDRFEASNLNRQLLALETTLDMDKAEAARQRVAAVNTSVRFRAEARFVDRLDLDEMLPGCGLAIDALGGLAMRLEMQRAAANAGVPLVTAALAGWSGYVSTVFPGESGPAQFLPASGSAAEDSLGTPAPAVAAAAAIQAGEAIKVLCGRTRPGQAQTLIFDLNDLSFERVRFG